MGKKGFDSSQTREVNMSKFYDARALELSHFTKIIKKKPKNTTKTPIQRVPKHMRRRAMAHNRFRIPSRIRAMSLKISGTVSETKTLKCRKSLRNSKLLMLHYFKRGLKKSSEKGLEAGSKWLESHIWHVKRMKMGDYFGNKIAIQNRNKCMRSSYKLSKFKSVMRDMSFLGILEMTYENFQEFSQLIQNNLEVEEEKETLYKEFLEGRLKFFITNFSIFDQAIGEMNFINDPITKKCLLISHPGVVNILKENLSKAANLRDLKIEVKIKNHFVNVFDIIGPHSLLCVKFALEKDIIKSKVFEEYIEQAYDPIYYPLFSSFCSEIKFDVKKKSLRSPYEPSIYEQDQNLEEFFKHVKEHKIFNFEDSEGVLEGYNKADFYDYISRFRVQTRGRYTHKKKMKIENEENQKMVEEKIPDSSQAQVESQNTEEKKEENENSSKKLLNFLREKEKENFKIIMGNVTDHMRKFRRIRIISPLGKGKKLWERIASKVALVVGKKELEYMRAQYGIKNFPGDFPNSDLFKMEEEQTKQELDKKQEKRPPKKRNNYQAVQSPDPHIYNFEKILGGFNCDELVEVKIEMLLKRNPEDRSYICFPRIEDFMRLRVEFKEENKIMQEILNNKNNLDEEQIEIFKDSETPQREIIGRCTKGFFGYDLCKGSGKGFVVKTELDKLEKVTKEFLKMKNNYFKLPRRVKALGLVKKVTSPYYHFCYLIY